jgi:hypothetical protein
MGYAVGDTCYPDYSAALAADVGRHVSSAVTVDGAQYLLIATVSSSQLRYGYKAISVGKSDIVRFVSPVYPSCEYLDYSDAFFLGWAVVAVWCAAWGWRALARGVHA